jgi:carbamate kinase
MLIVAALGSSALDASDATGLEVRAREVARSLAPLARSHTLLVLHHGARAITPSPLLPPDLAAACAAGAVGHLLARELRNALPRGAVVSLQANAVVPAAGATAAGIGGAHPCRFIELELLQRLAQDDGILLCVGCVPVGIGTDGCMVHSDAGLDEDASAACLATELGADILLLLTDVDAVYADWPTARKRIAALAPSAALAPGPELRSIGSKLAAAARFADTGEGIAMIGLATEAEALVAGHAGTRVSRRG